MSRGSWCGKPLEEFSQEELVTIILGAYKSLDIANAQVLDYKLKYHHQLGESARLRNRTLWSFLFSR